ncbi:Tigger transposable element-derived protein 4 [Araneus ventricosus]|uniref:Tigger transposable element-derived protein 4 n=1 Tax=Araneus ventricosus TaxID=182803 RepID=A0A4Y2ASA8_ARAVE|nr:Tigger transposable element-derived protein 4 [Araneus ventricosus]
MAMHKNNVLDIDTKMEIIKAKEQDNLRAKQIIEKFKIGKSQFYEIFKKKNEITELSLNGNGSTKRKMRKTAKEEINEIVWEWFLDARSLNLPISRPILQAHAKGIAEKLGKTDFHASNGWLESFRKRHGISFKAVCGEAGDVSDEAVNTWI